MNSKSPSSAGGPARRRSEAPKRRDSGLASAKLDEATRSALGYSATAGNDAAKPQAPLRSTPSSGPGDVRASMPVREATDLGGLLRQRRLEMGLSQQQFADLAGVGRRFVSEVEQGKATVEFGRVLQVCRAAGVRLTAA